jgi:hypothetical protein
MRVAVDPATHEPIGAPENVADVRAVDDFCPHENAGVAYLTRHPNHIVRRVPLKPARSDPGLAIVAGDPFTEKLIGPTSIDERGITGRESIKVLPSPYPRRIRRFAAENRRKRGERKPETFAFQGFTHIFGRFRGSRGFIVKRETATKRLRAKLSEVKGELAPRSHEPLSKQGKWLRSVVQGYFNYLGVPGNSAALEAFGTEITRSWLRALRRRGSRRRNTWQRFRPHVDRRIPRPKIVNPSPDARFDGKHPE